MSQRVVVIFKTDNASYKEAVDMVEDWIVRKGAAICGGSLPKEVSEVLIVDEADFETAQRMVIKMVKEETEEKPPRMTYLGEYSLPKGSVGGYDPNDQI